MTDRKQKPKIEEPPHQIEELSAEEAETAKGGLRELEATFYTEYASGFKITDNR